jgi:uncharacterized iron-regulated membrane protein
MVRRTLRTVHRWVGLVLVIPLFVQGATGAILAAEPWLPSTSATLRTGTPQPASAIVAAARQAAGPDSRALRYSPAAPGQPAQVQVTAPGGSPRTLLIDPVNLGVLGEAGQSWSWIRSLHVQFLAPAYGGRSIGGWSGLGLVVLLVSGIPIWWPAPGGWRAAITASWRASGVRFHRRLHGAVGVWTVAVLLVLVVTGVALAFPQTTRGLMGLSPGLPPGAPQAVRGGRPPSASAPVPDIDRIITSATAVVPDGRIRTVMLPSSAADAARVFMLHAGASGITAGVTVQVNGAGQVLAVQDARIQPAADRVFRWMHDLHEGEGLGPVWRLLTVIGGLSLPVLGITGPAMWWLRRRARRRLDEARRAALEQAARP